MKKGNTKVHIFCTNERIMCVVVAWEFVEKRVVNIEPGATIDILLLKQRGDKRIGF